MTRVSKSSLFQLLFFVVFFLVGDIHLSAESAVPEKAIVVGGNSSYPPYEYLDNEGKPAGFVVELTRAIAEAQGFTVIIKLGESWTDMRQALETGDVEVLQGISFNEEREKIMDFSTPHSFVSHSIWVRLFYDKLKIVRSSFIVYNTFSVNLLDYFKMCTFTF